MLLAIHHRLPLDALRRLLPFLVAAGAGAVVFAWMCDAVGDHDGVSALDPTIASWFVAHRSPGVDSLGLLLARATSPAVLITGVIVAATLLRRLGYRLEATILAGATFLAYVAGAVAKLGEHRARPAAPINLAPESEGSFPSGHVLVISTIVLVALGLAWQQLGAASRRSASMLGAGVVGVVALDRLVVGAHWLTDVIGAGALAVGVAAGALATHRMLARG